MADAVLPEVDLAKIRRYAAGKYPARLQDQIRAEVEVRGYAVTIVERRPPRHRDFDSKWTRLLVAQFRYDPIVNLWSLWWSDRNERWHRCDDIGTAPYVDRLLDVVVKDPTGVFWG